MLYLPGTVLSADEAVPSHGLPDVTTPRYHCPHSKEATYGVLLINLQRSLVLDEASKMTF